MPFKNQKINSEYQKKYRENNKEHLSKIIRQWQIKNAEKLKQQRKQYYLSHPEMKIKQKDKTNKRNHDLQEKIKQLIIQNGACERCGFSDIRALIIHHPNGNKTKADNYKSYKEIIEGKVKYEIICMNCHVIHHGTLHNVRNYH